MAKLTAAQLKEITKKATAKDPILVGDNGMVLKKTPFTAKIARSYEVNQGVKFTEYPLSAVEEANEDIKDEAPEAPAAEEAAPEAAASPNPPTPTTKATSKKATSKTKTK